MRCAFLLALLSLWLVGPAAGQLFLPDDPLWVDPDRLDMPAPEPRSRSDYYDFLVNTFGDPGDYDGPAVNINTLDEVPNSSWYTNRHYHRRLATEALLRGPDTVAGPDTTGPWRIVAGKAEGKTPGFQIEDARGDLYFLKFDPPGHLGLTTGAEVISTKFFHALGYHVPENYAVFFRPDRLVLAGDAAIERGGEEAPLTRAMVDTLLSRVPRRADGRLRALASRFLAGEKPLGPFLYHGTRPDDANDVFPHEGRRELRGLRVFSAWLHHVDARSPNTLDMLVEQDGRTYVRHHLIDFGSTLGAGAVGPKNRWDGHEYALEPGPILLRAVSLGFAGSGWVDYDYPGLPAVGRFQAEHFDPDAWQPQYPNPAFGRMDASDAFWAAKQVAHFTDEEIRAVVGTARYEDPEAARYIARTLIERRDRIAAAYLGLGGGLDRFRVEGGALVFDDLRLAHGLADAPPDRLVAWRVFDNATGEAGPALSTVTSDAEELPLPSSEPPFLMAEIVTPDVGATHVVLRREAAGYAVVGIERR